MPVPCFGPGPTALGTVCGPGPGAPVGVLEWGYPSIPNLCTGSCSAPRQGLPGDRQDHLWLLRRQDPGKRSLPGSHSRTKYSSPGGKAPARGACREGQSRQHKELAATRRASRQGPVSDKLPDPTRQGACRGRLTLCTHAPAHPPTCRSGGLSRRAWREAVQPAVRGGMRS